MIEEGQSAPDFELVSDEGERLSLSSLRGRPVVLYFYPKDDTPGCTTQACGIRDVYGELQGRGAVVLGVSPDGEASHAEFRAKYGLPFTLLSDPGATTAKAYGVWGERKLYGKSFMGINRSTFVIGPDGNVTRTFYGVKPDGHAELVLDALPV